MQTWSEAGYFGLYKDGIDYHISKVKEVYKDFGYTVKCKEKILASMPPIFDKLQILVDEGYTTDSIFMLNICICISDMILENVKYEPLIKVWLDLALFCNDNLPKNFNNFQKQLDTAVYVAEAVLKT